MAAKPDAIRALNGPALRMRSTLGLPELSGKARGATSGSDADQVTTSQKIIRLPIHATVKAIVRAQGTPAIWTMA